MVLFIKLKLEILYQSELFQKVAKIQASRPPVKSDHRETILVDNKATFAQKSKLKFGSNAAKGQVSKKEKSQVLKDEIQHR